MRSGRGLLAALLAAGLLLGSGAQAQTTELVSVASDGTHANLRSLNPAISADGRFVTFNTWATNLVIGDTNGGEDVFVHDRDTGTTERVSVASDGTQSPFSGGFAPAISAHGRFVSFNSGANNLVAGDTNNHSDIFVHDRDSAITERVSVASDGTQGESTSRGAAISANGRFVAFASKSNNLVRHDTNDHRDIFLHDRDTGITERVSVASDGRQGNFNSDDPALSADGRFVAFSSFASTLVPGDTNFRLDIFVHDRDSGTTELVSVASDGRQGNERSLFPAISAGGRFVAFRSNARNLVLDDTNLQPDIFVHDRDTGTTERVSVASDGAEANNASFEAAISADGRFVAFYSDATNLVSGDTNGESDIFVHDRVTGVTERVSVASDGTPGNGSSEIPAISADGRFVAFWSLASNLVAGDTNGEADIFVHDRGPRPQLAIAGHCPGRVSLSLTSATPNGSVGLVWGTAVGPFTVPPGSCEGTRIRLADPTLLMVLTADQSGEASLVRTVNRGACGILFQALDETTCLPSNLASVP